MSTNSSNILLSLFFISYFSYELLLTSFLVFGGNVRSPINKAIGYIIAMLSPLRMLPLNTSTIFPTNVGPMPGIHFI